MSNYTFVTSSEGKRREIKALIPEAKFIEMKLEELQPLSLTIDGSYEVLKTKAIQAKPYIVEDTSLFVDSMAGFPGSLVKYVSSAELCRMIPQNSKRTALALCLLGRFTTELEVFEGRLSGTIALSPRGAGFGWDDIFIPDGEYQTLAELGEEVKIKKYSMRTKALKELIGRT